MPEPEAKASAFPAIGRWSRDEFKFSVDDVIVSSVMQRWFVYGVMSAWVIVAPFLLSKPAAAEPEGVAVASGLPVSSPPPSGVAPAVQEAVGDAAPSDSALTDAASAPSPPERADPRTGQVHALISENA